VSAAALPIHIPYIIIYILQINIVSGMEQIIISIKSVHKNLKKILSNSLKGSQLIPQQVTQFHAKLSLGHVFTGGKGIYNQ